MRGQQSPRGAASFPCPGATPADGGSATAEIAIGLIGLSVVIAALLSLISVGMAKLATQDAATAAARALARGEAPVVAQDRARQVSGEVEVQVDRQGELARATARREVPILLPGAGPLVVESSATSVAEEAS